MHTDGSLQYRGRVMVPQLADLREEILREFNYSRFVDIQVAQRCTMIFIAGITGADEKTLYRFCSSMSPCQ